jgi:hypothetical protein
MEMTMSNNTNIAAVRTYLNLIDRNRKEVEYQDYAQRIDQRIAAWGDCIGLLPEPRYGVATTRIEERLLEAVARAYDINPHTLDQMLWTQQHIEQDRWQDNLVRIVCHNTMTFGDGT